MKITFIGTSHGVPEADRRCSSYLIETGCKTYIIDMGTSTVESLIAMGIHPDHITAVFFTHPHGDHMNGLVSFADLLSWFFSSADPVIFVPNEKVKPALEGWLSVTGTELREYLDIRITKAGVVWDDGIVKITSCPTQHCPDSCAFIVEGEGKTVLFTGDLRHPSVDYPEEAKKLTLDLAICETAHFSPKDFMPVWEESDVKHVIHTHVSPRWHGDLDELAAQTHDFVFGVAKDGMVIEL